MELEQKANEWSLEHQEGFCTHSMKVAAFKAGAQWARDIMHRDFETTISFIDMLNHSTLTKEEHKLLDYILDRCVDDNALRRIRRIYQPEHLKDIKMDYPLTPDECFKPKEDENI